MREVVYHRHAVRYLRKMPFDRKDQVKQAFSEVAKLVDPLEHPNVRTMTGEWSGCLRLRIGSYRAIFQLVQDEEKSLLKVLLVGPRGDIYN